MSISRTADVHSLAREVVRRHSDAARLPGRWDLVGRWCQRRYQSQLAEAPLETLRNAVADVERHMTPTVKN